MIQRGTIVTTLLLGFSLLLAGCESGSSAGSTKLAILSCSLGCSSATGVQVSCGVTDVAVNQEIRITFNLPLNIDTVDNNSFQVVQQGSGITPPQGFSIDPNDERVLIYRPLLTFDSSGNPNFGLSPDATYDFRIPGTSLDDPTESFIRSKSGQPNTTRLQCILVASQGVLDPKPGPPSVSVLVDCVDPLSGAVTTCPAQGAFNVSKDTTIRMFFNDVMNTGTLADPVSQTSDFVKILVDPDGNTGDPSDQVEVPGSFNLTLDQDALTTTLVFQPLGSFPSRGTDSLNPRRVVLRLPLTIADLGGNGLTNGGDYVFVNELIVFPQEVITESFNNTDQEDAPEGSPIWSAGQLSKSQGGGSGELGEMVLGVGDVVVLNSDSEDFSGIADTSIFNPQSVIGGVVDPMTGGLVTPLTDGVFEFSRLRISQGAVLRIEGSNPARVLVRGDCEVLGTLDLGGRSAPAQDHRECRGGPQTLAGAGGGFGGAGGFAPDPSTDFPTSGAMSDPDCVADMVTLYDDINGKDGGGIPVPDTLAPMSLELGGLGGITWPQPHPLAPTQGFPVDESNFADFPLDGFFIGDACANISPGAPGAGGAHGSDGVFGDVVNIAPSGIFAPNYVPPPDTDPTLASPADPGSPETMRLDPELGRLRGGGGGGGGAGHLQGTATNGFNFNCDNTGAGGSGDPAVINVYRTHSGAAGGAGGGGIQLQSGRRTVLSGRVNVAGGNGGGAITNGTAAPGGGGAGGGLLLQSPIVTIQAIEDRILWGGGTGGLGVNGSRAGRGGLGFVRLETALPLPDYEFLVTTTLSPNRSEVIANFMAGVEPFVTTAEYVPRDVGPGALSGTQSCWFQPLGNYFVLIFADDTSGLGWDLTLDIDGFTPQSYRSTANDLFAPLSIETALGNDIGLSPLVVRFQGARSRGPIQSNCLIDITDTGGDIIPGSLTPWVRHPEELNSVFADPGLQPNMIRFQVIWDASKPLFDMINGILDITFEAQPD